MQPVSSASAAAVASPILAMGEGARRASTKLKDSFAALAAVEKGQSAISACRMAELYDSIKRTTA